MAIKIKFSFSIGRFHIIWGSNEYGREEARTKGYTLKSITKKIVWFDLKELICRIKYNSNWRTTQVFNILLKLRSRSQLKFIP
jgi:hypothetical protein